MQTKAYWTMLSLLAGMSIASPLSAQTVSLTGQDSMVISTLEQNASPDLTPQLQALQFQQKLIALGSPAENASQVMASLAVDTDLAGLMAVANAVMLSPEASMLATLESLQQDVNQSEIGVSELAAIPPTTEPTTPLVKQMQANVEKVSETAKTTKISVMLDQLADKKYALKANLAKNQEDQVVAEIAVSDAVSEAVAPQETVATLPESPTNETPVTSNQPLSPIAQTSSTVEPTLPELQEQLLIPPLIQEAAAQPTYPPSLTFGIPSGFGPGWGDLYISASGATAGKARDGQVDGSISAGFGLGNPVDLIGLSFTYNLGSINNFGQNGTFDMAASRVVYADPITSVGVAAGWSAFGQYGNEGVIPSTVWGTITSYSFLQPDDPINKLPLLLSVGVGGGYYRQDPASTGVFGGIGLQVAPQLGLGLQWSGVGLNLGLSFVPVPTIPLTLQATGADLTDNSPGGTRFILSLSYGFNFLPPNAQ